MSMLKGNGLVESAGYASAGYARDAKQCKPDFETMIATAKKKRDDCQILLDAVTNLIDGNSIEGKMAELVGEVYGMKYTLHKRIEQLIKEEETWVD